MVDFDRVISRILSSGVASGVAGGLLAGALTSKAGRKLGRRALELGGVAAIAGLAYTAFERHRRGRQASLAGGPTVAFIPPAADPGPRQALGLALARTMIAAARADGKLDGRESEAVFAEIRRLDLDSDEKTALLNELGRSIGIDEIAHAARTPEQATELYTAALLAIEVDTPAERDWLSQLAARLALPSDLVAEIHARLADATREERGAERNRPTSKTQAAPAAAAD